MVGEQLTLIFTQLDVCTLTNCNSTRCNFKLGLHELNSSVETSAHWSVQACSFPSIDRDFCSFGQCEFVGQYSDLTTVRLISTNQQRLLCPVRPNQIEERCNRTQDDVTVICQVINRIHRRDELRHNSYGNETIQIYVSKIRWKGHIFLVENRDMTRFQQTIESSIRQLSNVPIRTHAQPLVTAGKETYSLS